MARRRRGLTDEERTLWNRVTAAATPLRPGAPADEAADGSAAADVPAEPSPLPLPNLSGMTPARPLPPLPARLPGRTTGPTVRFDPAPHPPGAPVTPRMDRSRFERLRRGRLEPEARLDLHGMTADRAHGALTGFILRSQAGGLRLVLVITGKGREGDPHGLAPHRHGILRHSVPHWLGAPPLVSCVLDVLPAHLRHGGSGALYVYLRRSR